MLVAVVGAMLLGEWSEAATVVFLFALAQLLEARSMDRARGAIRALMDLTPAEALVRRDGAERRVEVDAVSVGETIVIRPGEKIPLDGRVAAGQSYVNQAPVTGESLPVDKQAGRRGVRRHDQRPRRARRRRHAAAPRHDARAHHSSRRTRAGAARAQPGIRRSLRAVVHAGGARPRAGIATIPPLVSARPERLRTRTWIYRALVLLVISCPCALVISTPVSIVSALAAAARKGVLIKGGVHLERTRGRPLRRVRQDRHADEGPRARHRRAADRRRPGE